MKPRRIVAALAACALSLTLAACSPPAPPADPDAPAGSAGTPGGMTEVGTPRNETLIVQTFDGKNDNPDNMNPLMGSYAVWRGYRELAWGYLWEMDTATGESYPELADGMPTVLNDTYTQFEVKLKQGIKWSDGVDFTADDVIYTLQAYRDGQGALTYFGVPSLNAYIESFEKVDDHTIRIQTVNPAYDFVTTLGVYTWGSALNIVPKHIFEKETDLASFKNPNPVTLGAYTLKQFDPNGQWHLWERREDWKQSATGDLGEPGPKYVFYKNFGDEQTRTLAFIRNQYDVDTFMSPDSIKAAQGQNAKIETFSPKLPYHDMGDACSYGIIVNNQKAPYDNENVRWALALSLDLKEVAMNGMSGEVKVSALPMPDTQITRPAYFTPMESWLKDFKLADGYQPYNPNFGQEMVERLKETGVPADDLPTGAAVSENYGLGWWKHDPAQAEKLLAEAGITKGSDGLYQLNGQPWTVDFVIPSDWNKVMQRVGFSIADSWTKAGFKVNTRQVDNAEFTNVQNTNSLFSTQVNWTSSCVFNTNYLNSWRGLTPDNVKPVDSTEQLNANQMRMTDQAMFDLVAKAKTVPQDSAEFNQLGQDGIKLITEKMYYINMMNIPTTIPTNGTYWKGFPKAGDPYAVPYTWWSSFKKILVKLEPAS